MGRRSVTWLTRGGAVALAVLALVLTLVFFGGSEKPSRQAERPRAVPTTPETEPEATISTLPTSETVKNVIFERSYSECASFDRARLAAKYKVEGTSDANIATGVARGWVIYFKAGLDAIREGRSGCLTAFKQEQQQQTAP